MNEGIQKLIDAIQKASPVVWDAALRQVHINGYECLVGAILLFILCVVFLIGAFTAYDEDYKMGFTAGSFMCGIPAVFCVLGAIDYLSNPNFAALKEIIGLAH